jgi:hypothetical protein
MVRMKNYNLHDVLIGMFSNLPEGFGYKYDEEKVHEFFYNAREKYSVLDLIAFDNDSRTSKELFEDISCLRILHFFNGWTSHPNMDFIDKKVFDISFNKFSKNKFNNSELKELEKLSLEFKDKFS